MRDIILNRILGRLSLIVLLSVVVLLLGPIKDIGCSSTKPPISLMLVIDNSCSMFPEYIAARFDWCEVWGNDPDFLRIRGADLFIARLGFAEPNEDLYQIGIISMGEYPPKLFRLRSVARARDALAREIAHPSPQRATEIIPALDLVYRELANSPRGNQPAIVLLTDGIPYPREGQSNADIERIVASHPDVPLFVILLQNAKDSTSNYERYINFWKNMSIKYNYVQAYRVDSADEIVSVYNDIVARLQNTQPSPRYALAPGEVLNVYVGKYVQRLILTIMHNPDETRGEVQIHDSNGKLVHFTDPGVKRFKGKDNPVEVISIDSRRLDLAPRDDVWTVISDAPVDVFLDYEGAYDIQFVEPKTKQTSVTNQYLALEPHILSKPLVIKLRLIDKAGNVILDPQPITGQVMYPDGSIQDLLIPEDIVPDEKGIYEISYDFDESGRVTPAGRYVFSFNAGVADTRSGTRVPIAQADLLVEVGAGAYLEQIIPTTVECATDHPVTVTVKVGNFDLAQPESVRVKVLGEGKEVRLSHREGNIFTGLLDPLCQPLVEGISCGAMSNTSFRIRLVSVSRDGFVPPTIEQEVPVRIVGVPCTPTPTPTLTPSPTPTLTPTPTPTPIPNTDGDRLNDLEDKCIDQAEWKFLPYFQGCPPPWWALLLIALVGITAVFVLVWYVFPYLWVKFISPPPDGYVLICEGRRHRQGPLSLKGVGMRVRRSKISIGRKGHIRVPEMEGKLYVARVGGKAVVQDERGIRKLTIGPYPRDINVGDIRIRFSTDINRMKCS